jgi:hypothetical protein
MSWGYFADLRLTLATRAWKELLALKPHEVALVEGWSGLKDRELERSFARPISRGAETLASVLKLRAYRPPAALQAIETKGEQTRVRLLTLLDKSLLDLAQPLAASLTAAQAVGARGTLTLVNDGTYSGEDGVELVLDEQGITSGLIEDCWPLVDELGDLLFQRTTTNKKTKKKAPKKAPKKKPPR